VLRFESRDWDAYLATRSSNFRQTIRRAERKLAQGHDLAFRMTDASTLDRDLETLLRLHRERWGGEVTGFDRFAGFQLDFSRLAFERGWLRLWVLELDGEPAAAWHGFRYANVESYYQAGRADAFERLSVGLVLLAHTVREAQADGMDEYRFLRGDEPFKSRFTDDDPGLVTLAASSGALGGTALAAAIGARRLSRDVARRLRRSPRTAPPADAGRPVG
jgi:CelD/BcsL family acetyltransferase involved in cellulose biosynthesis